MILFEHDWLKYPNAIADTKTKNESFLRIARMYRDLGIRNHTFMLSLLQPELQGLDPYSEDLDDDTKALMILEARWNPWYFFREILKIPQQGSDPINLKANRGNIALYFTFFCNVDFALIQPRQTGKSVSMDGLTEWLIDFGTYSTNIILMTKDGELRKKNIERLKEMRATIPAWLLAKTSADVDNQIEITCKARKVHLLSMVAQNSESDANKAGRGITSPIQLYDETPFISYIDVALPAAAAAGTAARESAERNNQPYGNIFTTTAGKLDTREGKFMHNLIFGGAPWDERYVDAGSKENFRGLIENKIRSTDPSGMRRLIINGTFSHRQLGYSDEWLRKVISNTSGSPDAVERDFLNVWTSGSLKSPLPLELINKISGSKRDPDHVEITPDLFAINWYIPEATKREYLENTHVVWGVDSSDAVGRDGIALIGTDVRTLGTVAVCVCNLSNLYKYAQFLVDLLVRYKRTTLIIERKSSAQSIIDYLNLKLPMYNEDPFKRLYSLVVDDYLENQEYNRIVTTRLESRDERFYNQVKNKFGFNTTAESRNLLYSNILMNAARNAGHLVHDNQLASEIFGLVVKNGRIDHVNSGNDDTVIAWLLCHWFIARAKNISFYGIDSSMIMLEASHNGEEYSEENAYLRQQQTAIMNEIEKLVQELTHEINPFIKAQLQSKIHNLSRQIDTSIIGETFSLDALIEQAKQEFQKRARLQSLGQFGLSGQSSDYDRNSMYRSQNNFNHDGTFQDPHLGRITYV